MSNVVPDTRHSLILRLTDKRDIEAWDHFVSIYQPLVYRLARKKGLQDADAHEVVQEVMVAVSRAVDRWDPNQELGRFRDWLFTIARNLVINYVTRRKHAGIGTGDTAIQILLSQQQVESDESSGEFDAEFRREVFHWAAAEVRKQVRQTTWDAFWQTSIKGRSVVDVADELNMSVGAVHIARSRVLGRLRDAVQTIGGEQ